MTWPGLGVFRFDSATDEVVARPTASSSSGRLADIFARGVAPVILLQRGFEVLHASAVRLPRGIVAFCGRSGTGKSTLAAALGRLGYRQWADDALPLKIAGRDVTAFRLPFVPRVDSGRRPLEPALHGDWPPRRITLDEVAPLAGIFLLQRDSASGDVGTIRQLARADTLTAVLPHVHDARLGGAARSRQLVRNYLDLAGRVPVFELRFRPDLSQVPALASLVARHQAPAAAGHDV